MSVMNWATPRFGVQYPNTSQSQFLAPGFAALGQGLGSGLGRLFGEATGIKDYMARKALEREMSGLQAKADMQQRLRNQYGTKLQFPDTEETIQVADESQIEPSQYTNFGTDRKEGINWGDYGSGPLAPRTAPFATEADIPQTISKTVKKPHPIAKLLGKKEYTMGQEDTDKLVGEQLKPQNKLTPEQQFIMQALKGQQKTEQITTTETGKDKRLGVTETGRDRRVGMQQLGATDRTKLRIGSSERVSADLHAVMRENYQMSHSDRQRANEISNRAQDLNERKLNETSPDKLAQLQFDEQKLAQDWEGLKLTLENQKQITETTTRTRIAVAFLEQALSPFQTMPLSMLKNPQQAMAVQILLQKLDDYRKDPNTPLDLREIETIWKQTPASGGKGFWQSIKDWFTGSGSETKPMGPVPAPTPKVPPKPTPGGNPKSIVPPQFPDEETQRQLDELEKLKKDYGFE